MYICIYIYHFLNTKKRSRYFVPPKKIDDKDLFQVKARLLAERSYLITDIENGNNPELTQNVALLRDFEREKVRNFVMYVFKCIEVVIYRSILMLGCTENVHIFILCV